MRNNYYSQYDDDEVYLPPKRNPTPRRKQTFSRKLVSTLKKNPKRVAVGALFFGITAVVSLNALVMQSSRHPAPMFAAAPPLSTSQPAPAAQPLPPPAPPAETRAAAPQQVAIPVADPVPAASGDGVRRDAIADIIRTGSTNPAAASASAPRPAAPPRLAASAPAPRPAAVPKPPPRRDAIGDLIRTGGASAAPQQTAAPTDAQKRRVAAAQQALIKLGYGPLTADGVMGMSTQKAIKRFEFDRRLPVTGTFNQQTVAELSSTSRLAIR